MNYVRTFAIFLQQAGEALAAISELPKLLQSIERKLEDMDQKTQDAFDALRAEVAEVKNNEAAASTLLTGLHDQLDAALNSGGSSDDIVSAISDITTQLKSDTDALAAAVAANTPTAPGGSTGGTDTGTTDTGSGTGTDDGSAGTGEATDPTA